MKHKPVLSVELWEPPCKSTHMRLVEWALWLSKRDNTKLWYPCQTTTSKMIAPAGGDDISGISAMEIEKIVGKLPEREKAALYAEYLGKQVGSHVKPNYFGGSYVPKKNKCLWVGCHKSNYYIIVDRGLMMVRNILTRERISYINQGNLM